MIDGILPLRSLQLVQRKPRGLRGEEQGADILREAGAAISAVVGKYPRMTLPNAAIRHPEAPGLLVGNAAAGGNIVHLVAEDDFCREKNERKLSQLQHKKQQLENRIIYYEKGERRKRAHHLITRGAAIESVAPLTKVLTETEFYAFALCSAGTC